MPLLGNLQSALLYPLNIFLFLLPFQLGWSILVFLQPLLAGLFLYAYLIKLNVRREASLFGAITFAFSGFFIAWLEWNTLLHVALWLPLALLSIEHMARKERWKRWSVVLIASLSFSFLAGHVQTWFYLLMMVGSYSLVKLRRTADKKRLVFLFVSLFAAVVAITSIQWLPVVRLIGLSARESLVDNWRQEGWFIPWQHLIQFVAPDFFGNPATLNYYGTWNYAEMVGYVGIAPVLLAVYALIAVRNRRVLFFGTFLFISLIFATDNAISRIPFIWRLPLISTSQPTRLLFITDVSLAILAALGFNQLIAINKKERVLFKLIAGFAAFYGATWIFIVVFRGGGLISMKELAVTRSNLILPTVLFVAVSMTLLLYKFCSYARHGLIILLFGITVFDVIRFGWKFTPFTSPEYLFPKTAVIDYLMKQPKPFRIMATDKRILPPNFSSVFRIESIDVYDPLFLKTYGEFASAWARNKPDTAEIDFNRMITPQDFESRLADLLNVKYVLSLNELTSSKLVKVFEEGETKIYENKDVYPRAFLIESVISVADDKGAIAALFKQEVDLKKQAIVESALVIDTSQLTKDENAEIITYSENETVIKTDTMHDRFLVLADSYYPTWKAYIDGKETIIYRTDFTLRGVVVPKGQHMIVFSVGL